MRRLLLGLLLAGLHGLAPRTAPPASPPPQSAPAPAMQFERIPSELGLSQNLVTAILQDRRGFLWFGTRDGLNRFDGYRFTVFQHDPADPASLSDSDVGALYEDRAGRIWVGTQNGLNLFDRGREIFHRLLPVPGDPHSLSHPSVDSIAEDREGAIWLGTWGGGVNRLVLPPPADGGAAAAPGGNPLAGARCTRFAHVPGDPDSLGSDFVAQVVADGRGTVWAKTLKGLCRLVPAGTGYRAVRFRGGADRPDWLDRDECAKFICRRRAGGVWIGGGPDLLEWDAASGTLRRHGFDFRRVSIRPWQSRDDFWDSVRGMMEDRAGKLWIGSTWGLARFDPAADTLDAFRHEPGDPHSIAESGVMSICEDSGGVMWFGSNGNGLFRHDPKAERFSHRHPGAARISLWRGSSVRSLCETRDGTLWVGTSSIQLLRLNRATGETTAVTVAAPGAPPPELALSMLEDRAGRFWIGASAGLYELARRDGNILRARYYKPEPGAPPWSPGDAVFQVVEDQSGGIWIATCNRFSRLDRATGRFTEYRFDSREPGTIPKDAYIAVHQDRGGAFWLGTPDGLLRFDPSTGLFRRFRHDPRNPASLSHDVVRAIAEDPLDPGGVLWLGTAGGGLNRFDRRTGTFACYTRKDGLPSNVIYAILGDAAGDLWMSTNHGLARFDPRARRFKNYDIRDGLQDNEFNACAYFRSAAGELFFGGISGFNAFHPADVRDNPHVAPVVFTDFQILNRSVSYRDPDSPLRQSIGETRRIVLSPGQKVFSFQFAALDFTEPTKNQYAYMMENFDPDWRLAGTSRTATYTNLDPGEYVFRVRASNNDGVWNERGAAIAIAITPPWWRTGWAYAVFLLVLVAGVLAADRIQRRRLIRTERERAQLREAELVRRQAEELETIDRIVRVINRTADLESLFQALLEQALKLVPHAEKATVLVLDRQEKCFRFAATVGYELDRLRQVSFTPEEMVARYTLTSEEVEPGVYILRHTEDLAAEDKLRALPRAQSMLIMAVEWDGTLEGYLVLDNLTDAEAFDRSDAHRLNRLGEHAISAIAKANTLKTLAEKSREIVRTQEQLVVQEKLASLGSLTAGIAHEIKNPLNFVNNFATLSVDLADELREALAAHSDRRVAEIAGEIEGILADVQQNAARISEHGRRADSIVQNMLQLSRGRSGEREATDVNHLLEEAVNLTYHGLRARDASFHIDIERDYDRDVGWVDTVPQDLNWVFLNLLNNACQAAREKQRRDGDGFRPALRVASRGLGEKVEIRIRDNGDGIPPAIQEKIFHPFFTTRPAGQGLGLGLSISYDLIVQKHQGEIRVDTEVGEYAEFVVLLPRNPAERRGTADEGRGVRGGSGDPDPAGDEALKRAGGILPGRSPARKTESRT